MVSRRTVAASVILAGIAGGVLTPIAWADDPAPSQPVCTALGQIAESLNDDIGAGLQPRGLRRYDITQLTHGVSYMNQVNANARISALDVPLRNLTSTINDLQNQYQLVTVSDEDGTWHPMSASQEQDLDQASAQQDTLTGLVSQLQQSNHCPAPPAG